MFKLRRDINFFIIYWRLLIEIIFMINFLLLVLFSIRILIFIRISLRNLNYNRAFLDWVLNLILRSYYFFVLINNFILIFLLFHILILLIKKFFLSNRQWTSIRKALSSKTSIISNIAILFNFKKAGSKIRFFSQQNFF